MDHPPHQLSIENLSFSYGPKQALHQINAAVHCGQRLALLGPNGAGKSTLIRLLAGLLRVQAGKILWGAEDLAQARREVAYLPQTDQHQRHFPIRVCDVVAMGRFPHLGNFRPLTKKDRLKIDDAISLMNLHEIAHRQIDQLSGGQQQRTFIARALAQEAHILLLDEPFNGLDVESRGHLANSLRELSSSDHLIIASHHQLESVTQIFTHALVLDQKQIAFGPAPEVMANDSVRSTLQACPALPA